MNTKISHSIFYCLIFSFILGGCLSNYKLQPEQIIKSSDCENITVTKNGVENRTYCLTSIEKLKKLYRSDYLYYVGSNENHHFFNWYVKQLYYQSQPQGFAVPRSEYIPNEEFDVQKNQIGESPFKK